ncbi:type I secretion target repeat protein [endosymbiont of Riftia pachyptila (vent Ph05)]|uniref:Type I secretion target repeat protein n=1 Tax=endosymbiont of Riftia pachyptila (vent Ph05) TaxID=1048808 RepID=G2DC80_9GAMM|nr:type I secretion target repeat protein [endosymbiont of Riftia pachyptila (vent Ph05)]
MDIPGKTLSALLCLGLLSGCGGSGSESSEETTRTGSESASQTIMLQPTEGTGGSDSSSGSGLAGEQLVPAVGAGGGSQSPAAQPAHTARDDSFDVTINSARTLDVLANDSLDSGAAMILSIESSSQLGGTVRIVAANLLNYTPPSGQASSATDRFSYTLGDTNGASSSATVTLSLTLPSTSAHTANDDSVMASHNSSQSIDILANDQVDSSTTQLGGSVVIAGDNSVTYTPPGNITSSTTDSFGYTLADSFGLTSAAIVSVPWRCRPSRPHRQALPSVPMKMSLVRRRTPAAA